MFHNVSHIIVFLLLYYRLLGRTKYCKVKLSVDPGVGGRIILRWIFRKGMLGDVDWIELARDRDRWRELVSVVMNLRVS
jgi:hypothetical protein